jgi:hypothetical protein
MDAAISIPDGVYNEALQVSEAMHISLGKLYLEALQEYLARAKAKEIINAYNEDSSVIKPVVLKQWMELTKDDTW